MSLPRFETTEVDGRTVYHCPGHRSLPIPGIPGATAVSDQPCPWTLIAASDHRPSIDAALEAHWLTMHDGIDAP